MGSSPISETEILRRIHEAQREHKHDVVFTWNQHKVKLHLPDMEPKGMYKGYEPYYRNGG